MKKLDDILALLMPQMRRAQRRKRFADFLRHEVTELGRKLPHPFSDAELVRIVQDRLELMQQEGISQEQFKGYAERIPVWHAATVSSKRQANAAKRWELEREKKRLKAERAKQKKAAKTSKLSYDTVDEWDHQEHSRTPIRKAHY